MGQLQLRLRVVLQFEAECFRTRERQRIEGRKVPAAAEQRSEQGAVEGGRTKKMAVGGGGGGGGGA